MILRLFGKVSLVMVMQFIKGANRYYLNNFFMQQHKLEIKGKLFLREDILPQKMETHMTCFFTGINIIEFGKMIKLGLGYAATYAGATLNGSTPENAYCSEKCS
jgi:hypothetical protein